MRLTEMSEWSSLFYTRLVHGTSSQMKAPKVGETDRQGNIKTIKGGLLANDWRNVEGWQDSADVGTALFPHHLLFSEVAVMLLMTARL